jgi:tRNA threonylcarbamoyl adenosine modification protein (Sua5/YciO/YrdC/YwlC family)
VTDADLAVVELAGDHEGAIERAAAALAAGGVIVLPTDTVYGLAALPGDRAATDRLFELKGRSEQTPLAVLCGSRVQALDLVDPAAIPDLEAPTARWWPGPLTIVAPRRVGVHLYLGEPSSTIGLRVPDHDVVRQLAGLVGPIAATSANRHGHVTPATAVAAAGDLLGPVDLVVDGGVLGQGASTVVDATQQPWRVLREGPITALELGIAPR